MIRKRTRNEKRQHDTDLEASLVPDGPSGPEQTLSYAGSPSAAGLPDRLTRLRNIWEFACLVQYLFLFGKKIGLKELDLDELETSCLGQHRSERLTHLGSILLKFLMGPKYSASAGFDAQLKEQYDSRNVTLHPVSDPDASNTKARSPTNAASNPPPQPDQPFADLALVDQVRVLHQLSVWTFASSDKLREGSQGIDQTEWRIEPFGWDGQDRAYFLLDDDRLYRMTDIPTGKARTKTAAKKRRITNGDDTDPASSGPGSKAGSTLGNKQWECIAVTLDDYNTFIRTLNEAGDPNEKLLLDRIRDNLLPVIEKREAARLRKEQKRLRDLELQLRLTTVKRSSRIAERRKKEEEEQKARADDDSSESEDGEDGPVYGSYNKHITKPKPVEESAADVRKREWKARVAKVAQVQAEIKDLHGGLETGTRISKRQLDKKVSQLEESIDWVFNCICGNEAEPALSDDMDEDSDDPEVARCNRCRWEMHPACVSTDMDDIPQSDFECPTCREKPIKVEDPPRKRGRPERLHSLDTSAFFETDSPIHTPVLRSASHMSPAAPIFPPPSRPNIVPAPLKQTPNSQPSQPVQHSGSAVSSVPKFKKPSEHSSNPAPVKPFVPGKPLPSASLQLSPSLSVQSRKSSMNYDDLTLSPRRRTSISPRMSPRNHEALLGSSPSKMRVSSMPLQMLESPRLVPPFALRPSQLSAVDEGIAGASPSMPTSPVSPTLALSPNTSTLLPPVSAGISPRKMHSPRQVSLTPGQYGSSGVGALADSPGLFPAPHQGRLGAGRSVSLGGLGRMSDIDRSGLPAILSSSPLGKSPVKNSPRSSKNCEKPSYMSQIPEGKVIGQPMLEVRVSKTRSK